MILDAVIVVPQMVAVHVSVTSPPQAPGMVLRVDVAIPLILQSPINPLSYASSWVVAPPHETLISATVANTGVAAGLMWMILDAVIVVPQTVAVHVSVTSPPHAPGMVLRVDVTIP